MAGPEAGEGRATTHYTLRFGERGNRLGGNISRGPCLNLGINKENYKKMTPYEADYYCEKLPVCAKCLL